MGLFDRFKYQQVRSLENPYIPVSADNFLHILVYEDTTATSGATVNVETAPSVPAIWASFDPKRTTLIKLALTGNLLINCINDLDFKFVKKYGY